MSDDGAGAVQRAWDPRSIPTQQGRAFLVTGANAGLGYFSSEQLARAGAHVIMSGRNPNRLADARSALVHRVPGASVETMLLDTSNLGSVRAAAASIGARVRLDGLLLNAGDQPDEGARGVGSRPRTHRSRGRGRRLLGPRRSGEGDAEAGARGGDLA